MRNLRSMSCPLFCLTLSLVFLTATEKLNAQHNDHPSLALQRAVDLGPVDPNEEANITVHLRLTNEAVFDKTLEELYDPDSPRFHHWLDAAQLSAFAPSAKAIAAVKNELLKNGLTIISESPNSFFVRAHGTVGSIQNAFQTEIHQYSLNGKTIRGHVKAALLTGGADAYVGTVAGLDGAKAHPLARSPIDPRTGKAREGVPLSKVKASGGGLGAFITDNCFTAPATLDLAGSTPLPIASYTGNVYDNNVLPCAFTPAQLESNYGLHAAYAKGYDGTGESIVLLEAYGYPTIEADANAQAQLAGLPPLSLEVIYPEGKPKNPNAAVELGWDVEIALDVQAAHTAAPNAKIIVVAAAGQDNEDFQDAILYAVRHKLAPVISASWETDNEQFAGVQEVNSYNYVLMVAAAQGVSVNFSTGDNGDEGNPSGATGAPNVPADSPYATAVGGTAILKSIGGKTIEVGWGDVLTYLGDDTGPSDPPIQYGFYAGAGGGESVFFSKPSWQESLPGTGRQIPDVSALADPYTGYPIVLTTQGQQYLYIYGGTSLATPLFSGIWVLANQYAQTWLGQAAPNIAQAHGHQVRDIVRWSSVTNPAGVIFDSAGATYYSPSDLLSAGIEPPTVDFVSATWPVPVPNDILFLVVGFGLDTSLSVTPGWDNVTGFGVPNGLAFIEGFK